MNTEAVATQDYGLCTEDCDYLEDKSIWVVNLSNSLTVFQDDDRSGKEPVAWKRLWDYCNSELVDIVAMYLQFRSNRKMMPEGDNIQGYYFAYGAHKEFDEHITRMHYVSGYVEEGRLNTEWYRTPELLSTKRKISRTPEESDIQDKRLILKHEFRD